MIGELFVTFVADQKKLGRDLADDYCMEIRPDEAWKKLMQRRLDKKIDYLQMKRRKFD